MGGLDNILRFDSIRILKLLEIFQFSLIGLILGYINGHLINKYILIEYKSSNYINKKYPRKIWNRNPILWLHLIWDAFVIVISTYYLKKISALFPFIFDNYNPKYVSSLKNENILGFTIGLGFIYMRLLDNFQGRINLLMGGIDD